MIRPEQRIFLLFIFSIYYGITIAADLPCGDWEPYKDEKCFKIFDKVVNEDEAEKICSQQENDATLVTIHSKDEQDFLSNLFKTHKIVDGVWIGAKYGSNKFMWVDDSDLSFTNWAEGSPSNTVDKACVQMVREGSSIGKWADEPCIKSNKVVCQKMQNWSISRLQKTILDARKVLQDSLEEVRKQMSNQQATINNQQTTINNQQTTIKNLEQNPVPIGFIYVQLPGQPDPKSFWSSVVWTDVSSTYAGLFFRVLGGSSGIFEEVQNENSPRLSQVSQAGQPHPTFGTVDSPVGQWSNYVATGNYANSNSCDGIKFLVSGGEVRPRNQAVRIWKRTN